MFFPKHIGGAKKLLKNADKVLSLSVVQRKESQILPETYQGQQHDFKNVLEIGFDSRP